MRRNDSFSDTKMRSSVSRDSDTRMDMDTDTPVLILLRRR
jgi:hypothetical protein